jgi:PIN domain nuclease of toxin-antitoxin system
MLVIDTHILLWWVNDDKQLSAKARAAIQDEMGNQGSILVSSISAWEIAMLVNRNRLTLTMDLDKWLQVVSEIDCLRFVPIDNKVALESTRLPGSFHKDPADRMIVALARNVSAPLVNADDKILAYSHVKTIYPH